MNADKAQKALQELEALAISQPDPYKELAELHKTQMEATNEEEEIKEFQRKLYSMFYKPY